MDEAKWMRYMQNSNIRYRLDGDFELITSKRRSDLKAAAMAAEVVIEPVQHNNAECLESDSNVDLQSSCILIFEVVSAMLHISGTGSETWC